MKKFLPLLLSAFAALTAVAQQHNNIGSNDKEHFFPIVSAGQKSVTPIYVDSGDDWLVRKAATLLAEDIQRITGRLPNVIHTIPAGSLSSYCTLPTSPWAASPSIARSR